MYGGRLLCPLYPLLANMYSHAHFLINLFIDPFAYIPRISHTNIWAISIAQSKAKQNQKLVCQHNDFPSSRAQVTQIPTVSLLTSPQTSLKQMSRAQRVMDGSTSSLHQVQNPLRLLLGSPASFTTGSLTTWDESSFIACTATV